METEKPKTLEEAYREIDRLLTENAELRRRLNISSESQLQIEYTQNGSNPLAVSEEVESLQPQQEVAPELPLSSTPLPLVDSRSPIEMKLNLYRTLFKGRNDVYAVFWMNQRTGKKGYSPASETSWNSGKGKPKKYRPLTDEVLLDHLRGKLTIGLYPLLNDNACWFLACDFDKGGWILDATAFLKVCEEQNVPAYLERSRSGNGGHVWVFFSSPVPAVTARQLGMRLLRQTMVARAEMDLASYDRFFPNQDFMPRGGFGNLIALPLQKDCRTRGNTEFLDLKEGILTPWPDQWSFLSQVRRLTSIQLQILIPKLPAVEVGPEITRSVPKIIRQKQPAPSVVQCTLGSACSVEKSGIPPWMLSQLKHLAFLHNPKFYERQKLRLSTFRIPRFIKCHDEDMSHIHLPRGLLEAIREIAKEADSKLSVTDLRQTSKKMSLKFLGKLMPAQEKAVDSVLRHDMGVLVAPTGSGKTVMGCYAVAKRSLPTLILAHRKPILEQWRAQLIKLLDLPTKQIGQLGGGRNRQTGIIDLGMIQSLQRIEDLEGFFANYGFIIVDECHHLPAFTFETCIKRAPTRYFLGLTATPYRRDGLQDMIMMQCGPIRFRMSAPESSLERQLFVHKTSFHPENGNESLIQELFRALVLDEERNKLILEHVREALDQGRRCLILSDWKEHCRLLEEVFRKAGFSPYVLSGDLGKKERAAILKKIEECPLNENLLVIATGQYLGEGFDCPQLDTLFLAFPVSFRGKLIQYVGRASREHSSKNSIIVHDYADLHSPILKKMHVKRLKAYQSLGFKADKKITNAEEFFQQI